MAIWYVHPETGSDLNGGDSWAVVFTNTDGVANGTTTFTSATGGFTGKENRWIWIRTKNLRRQIVTVNSDTSVVLNSTVTAGSGLTFTLGGALQIAYATGVTLAAGDVIRLPEDTGQADMGSATWTNDSDKVTLAAAKNMLVDHCTFPWIANTNVTAANSANASKKPFDASTSLSIASGFTTGKVGYQRLYTKCSGGTATASTTYSGSSAEFAFDNLYNTYHTNNNALPTWLKYDFGSGVQKTWTAYMIVGGSQQNYDPKTWKLQGSNNDTDWTDLDSQTSVTLSPRLSPNWFTIASPAAYRYYRLYVTAAYAVGNYVSLRMVGYTEGAYDFSAYQQLSFWGMVSVATAANVFQMCLCSDTTGDTVVDTLNLPDAYPTVRPFTIDKGSALGNSIQSVALYAASDPGTIVYYSGSIVAAKAKTSADCLTFTSTISNGAGNMEYGVDSIDGADIRLADQYLATNNNQYIRWYGTTGSFTSYVRQCIQQNGTTVNFCYTTSDGTSGNPILFSGGWNPTSNTQTGVTWISSQNLNTFSFTGDYVNVEKIGLLRGDNSLYLNGCIGSTIQLEGAAAVQNLYLTGVTYNVTLTCGHVNCTQIQTYNGVHDCTFTFQDVVARRTTSSYCVLSYTTSYNNIWNFQNLYGGTYSIYLSGTDYSTFNVAGNIKYSGTYGLYVADSNTCTINFSGTISLNQTNYDIGLYNSYDTVINNATITAGASGAYPIWVTGYTRNCVFNNFAPTGHTFSVVGVSGTPWVDIHFHNITTALSLVPGNMTRLGSKVTYDAVNGDPNDNRTYYCYGNVVSQTTVRYDATGIAWKLAPTNTTYVTSRQPILIPIAQIYCEPSTTYTVTARMRRSNTGLTCGIRCIPHQVEGITELKSDTVSTDADEWDLLSISFTPTENGVATIEAFAYGGTTYLAYVDSMGIT